MKVPNRVQEYLLKMGLAVKSVQYRLDVPIHPVRRQAFLLGRAGIDCPVIFDVGANKGDYARYFRNTFSTAQIYCFEPYPPLVKRLKQRFSEDSDIRIIPDAVSDSRGKRSFHLTGMDTTNSLLPRASKGRRYYSKVAASKGEKIEVESITLDDYIEENEIPHIDILKFDIQGGEMAALRGASRALAENKFSMIFLEAALIAHYDGEAQLQHLAVFLENFHYSLYGLFHIYQAHNGQARYCEALFVSKKFRKDVLDRFPPEP